jgi:hypothetical protein
MPWQCCQVGVRGTAPQLAPEAPDPGRSKRARWAASPPVVVVAQVPLVAVLL